MQQLSVADLGHSVIEDLAGANSNSFCIGAGSAINQIGLQKVSISQDPPRQCKIEKLLQRISNNTLQLLSFLFSFQPLDIQLFSFRGNLRLNPYNGAEK